MPTPEPPSASDHAARLDRLDVARGIGIVLVVYQHAFRGLVAAGLAPADRFYVRSDALVYAFHVPIFFLLSGLFAGAARDRGGRGTFLRGRVQTIFWPYLLWSFVQGAITLAMPGSANHPVRLADLARVPIQPIGEFWFLYTLFACNLVLLLPRRWFFLAAAAMVPVPAWLGQGTVPLWCCAYILPFAVGVAVGARRLADWLERPKRATAIALASWAVFAAVLAPGWSTPQPGPPASYAVMQLAGLAGAIGTVAVAWLLPMRGTPLLATLGRASMPIYLLHVIAVAFVRVLVARLGWHPGLGGWLALLTVAGLALPLAAYRISCRAGLDALLGFGRRPRGPARLGGGGSPLELTSPSADVAARSLSQDKSPP